MTSLIDNKPLATIYQKKNGLIADLEHQIGEEKVRQYEAMGYIVNAPSEKGNTWAISEKAKKMARLTLSKVSLWEKVQDWYLIHVRHVSLGF